MITWDLWPHKAVDPNNRIDLLAVDFIAQKKIQFLGLNLSKFWFFKVKMLTNFELFGFSGQIIQFLVQNWSIFLFF